MRGAQAGLIGWATHLWIRLNKFNQENQTAGGPSSCSPVAMFFSPGLIPLDSRCNQVVTKSHHSTSHAWSTTRTSIRTSAKNPTPQPPSHQPPSHHLAMWITWRKQLLMGQRWLGSNGAFLKMGVAPNHLFFAGGFPFSTIPHWGSPMTMTLVALDLRCAGDLYFFQREIQLLRNFGGFCLILFIVFWFF